MKRLLQLLLFTLLIPATVFSLVTPSNNFEIEGIVTDNTNIKTYDKHHPFLGLFGAGFADPTNKNASFASYYDFCKDHGDGNGVELGDFNNDSDTPLANNPKHNFKMLVEAIENSSANIITDGVSITLNPEITTTNLETVFDTWRAAHDCDKYFTHVVGIGRNNYTLSTDNTSQVDDKPYQKVNFNIGGNKVRYLYCYTNSLDRDRDIALFLSQDNTNSFLGKIDDRNSGDGMLHDILLNFLSVGNAEDEDTIASNDTSSFYLNIQGVTFPETPGLDSATDTAYNDLITNSAVENSGLGHYCKEIHDMHDVPAQTNAGNIETCIKNHVSAVLDGSGAADGICSNERCGDRTIGSTNVKGLVENDIYIFPDFGYCSNDSDLDGFLSLGNEYNWGEFTATNMVPYANVPDVCPDNAQSTTELPTWFENGNPTNTRRQCDQPTGFLATAESATPSYQFQATVTGNVVTLARTTTQSTELKELQISSENSQISIVGKNGADNTVIIQASTSPLSISENAGQTSSYCYLVKGNASNLTDQYLIKVSATGSTQGLIETFKQIDAEQETYKALTLNNDGEAFLGTEILTKGQGCSLE